MASKPDAKRKEVNHTIQLKLVQNCNPNEITAPTTIFSTIYNTGLRQTWKIIDHNDFINACFTNWEMSTTWLLNNMLVYCEITLLIPNKSVFSPSYPQMIAMEGRPQADKITTTALCLMHSRKVRLLAYILSLDSRPCTEYNHYKAKPSCKCKVFGTRWKIMLKASPHGER